MGGGGEAGSDRLVGRPRQYAGGLWRPTLRALLVAVRGKVAPHVWPITLDYLGGAKDKNRRGFEQIDRRLRTVASTVETLPWWRRTAQRWRRELAALPGRAVAAR